MVYSHSIIPSTKSHMRTGQRHWHVNVTLSHSFTSQSTLVIAHAVGRTVRQLGVKTTQYCDKRRSLVRLPSGRSVAVINPIVVAVGLPIGNSIVISVSEPTGVEILRKDFPINWMRPQ